MELVTIKAIILVQCQSDHKQFDQDQPIVTMLLMLNSVAQPLLTSHSDNFLTKKENQQEWGKFFIKFESPPSRCHQYHDVTKIIVALISNGSIFRFKRLGSSHGHVDPKNANRFSGLSTFNHDYIQHGFSKPNQIRPNENNIEFGKDEADHYTSHSKLGFGLIYVT